MIYGNKKLRFSLLALLLALALVGNFSFTKVGASPPPALAGGPGHSLPLADKETHARVEEGFGKLPLYFVENNGQLDKRVAYYVKGADKTIYFTNRGLTFSLNKPTNTGQAEDPRSLNPPSERWTLKLDFVGARSGARPVGQDQTGATFSYFKGSRSQWKAGLKSYSQVVYHDLWKGIDLVYAGTVNRMKYTFVVKPGADPNQIKLAYRGASGVKLNEAGELEVKSPAGGFTDERPVSWQEVDGQRIEVASKYQLAAGNKQRKEQSAIGYGFAVGNYDRSRELVIDPAVLVYCGYLDGSGSNGAGRGIAVDSAGNAYVSGTSGSTQTTFPVTVGPDLTFNGSTFDAFVAKVNASGTALIYCGYIGGNNFDQGNGIAVDSAGNAYVTGFTESTESSFPVTVGPDLTFNGTDDVFVAKVNASGTALDYCGYIGGSASDEGNDIAVDSAGIAYVSGNTSSTESSFPVTVGPDLTYNGGSVDAFVAKVKANGTALDYCGYIGGSNVDQANGIAVASAGNAYVTGITNSTEASFPVTVGPDLTHNGGFDFFVTKVNAGGTALDYCGYIGGNGSLERNPDIAVDSAGAAYVTGQINSTEATFPVTVGPDLTFNGTNDAFVAKVNASGTALDYCGYIGGSGNEGGNGIAVDSMGNAYVTGGAGSSEATFPVTVGPDLTFNGGADAFVAKVNASGTALIYCGYIGGSGNEGGSGIAVDSMGNAYVGGTTSSTEATFPVTVGPDLTYNGGFIDNFVAKISTPPPLTVAGWGDNSFGQLNIPAGLTDVTAISAGFKHSLALKSDGTVVGWGNSDSGAETPPAGLTDVIAISAGAFPSLALKSDGTVVGWGNSGFGAETPPAGLTNVIAISTAGTHSLALKSDGTVVGWGSNVFGETTIPAGLSNVTAIAAGGIASSGLAYSLALKSDGTVVGWGSNFVGETTIPAGLTDVIAIDAGFSYNLALKSDGTVVGWGVDVVFGSGAETPPAGLSDVVAISAGVSHSLALKSDGTVVGWGDNSFAYQATPPGCISSPVAISAGGLHSLAMQIDSCVQIGCPPAPPQLTALGPANVWVGLKNSDDIGTKFDLKAEVFKNDEPDPIGSGILSNVSGSSGFNGAVLRTIALALPAPVSFSPSDTLKFRLSVRIAVGVTGHRSGTARLWYNDAGANSRLDATIDNVAGSFYLREGFALQTTAGPGPKRTVDVTVDRAVGENPFKPFGTWVSGN